MTERCTRFIILGDARTGSTMLAHALQSHPQIVCFGEIFNSAERIEYAVPGYERRAMNDLPVRNGDPASFLRNCVFAGHPAAVRACGFKFHYGQFWAFEGLAEILTEDHDLRIVHLLRRNRLRTLVSSRIVERTQRWLEFPPEPSLRSRFNFTTLAKAARNPRRAFGAVRRKLENKAPPGQDIERRITLTVDECRNYFQRVEFSEKHWEKLMEEHTIIRVYFEDLVLDPNAETGRIQRFLGVEPAPVEVRTVRQNPEPLRELIANYDDLRASFAGTDYEAWFDD